MKHVRPLSISTLLVLATLVACGPTITDTGYVGTWKRTGPLAESTLSIVADGDGYRFRWGYDTKDERVRVRCDWEGQCEKIADGEAVARYRFRTWVDDESGRLRVECTGTQRDTTTGEELPVQYVDELVVREQGRKLISRTIERNGQQYEGRARPKRVFEKADDGVVSPPSET